MNHEEPNACALCEAELIELYRVKHGIHLPSLKNLTIPQKLDMFKMNVDCAPDWKQNTDPYTAIHFYDHFEGLTWKECPPTCKSATRDTGEGTCDLCCKERALRKHLGDDAFEEEVASVMCEFMSEFDGDDDRFDNDVDPVYVYL